ncbi:D-2-hydroxyacid dehydrogenase [Paenibacillus sp. FSL R10-2734]|uniref:D-2-hydroxyacid dehydrogenase n=1 Tax=Paenibacillus sp. FSL R10-2734 TaxID=2954691 RepID=UPI0030DB3A76
MNIIILDGYTLNPGDLNWEGFERIGKCTIYDRTAMDQPNEVIERIGDAEIVITNKTPISREVIEACPHIKYIGILATGYNVIDTQAALEKEIIVTNVPTYGTHAVGQFAIALLLEICHHIGHHSQQVKEGAWANNLDWCFWDYPLIELLGKTMGIIGFGSIGQATGTIAKAMGMNVLACDPYPSNNGKLIATYVNIDTLFEQADVIVLHSPLLPSSEGIINKSNIEKMKHDVIIINNSRGALIVEQDLAEALNNRRVQAAGLDVVTTEPIRADNPLLYARNCIITPHISWASKESRARLMAVAVRNLQVFLQGMPVNVVNRR